MKTISNTEFGGERPLFASYDLRIENVTIHAGESALKECSNIDAVNCRFEGKYPFWHVKGFSVRNCLFTEGARAALWYSNDLVMSDTLVEAPKMFREMDGISLENVQIPNAQETLWHCCNVELKNVSVDNADYLFMHGENIHITGYRHSGNYSFQYCRNVEIRNADINSKDAFWNSENVTVYDSFISGEYLGWNAKNLTLINCTIESLQGMCCIDNLVMKNCKLLNTTLAFEYSTVDAEITGKIDSVMNPSSGVIRADSIDELIVEKDKVDPSKTKIICGRELKEAV